MMGAKSPRANGPDIRLVKRDLRRKFRRIRSDMDPQDKAAWDERITANLLRSPRWRRARRAGKGKNHATMLSLGNIHKKTGDCFKLFGSIKTEILHETT